jgi:co-chaperonin GroES (HSP10)
MSEVAEVEKPRTFLDNAAEEARKLKAVPAQEREYFDVEPLNQWVLIRKIERVQTKVGDTELVTKVDEERSSVGIVLAISPNCKQGLAVGDRVLYTNYALTLEDLEEATGDPLNFIVREEEVFCRLRPRPRIVEPQD